MKIATLVKQVPAVESLTLDSNGRLLRAGVAFDMNPYCRRALSLAVTLSKNNAGHSTALTLAPESGEDVIREALAAGADDGILISDPAFAGSDTLATAHALAAALRIIGPVDLIVCGLNSVDADTGQVGPQVAQLLGMPFVANVKSIVQLEDRELQLKSLRDDGSLTVRVNLPAVISVAERSVKPIRISSQAKQAIKRERIRYLRASDLGDGPWGEAGSPTRVGIIRRADVKRFQHILHGPLDQQVAEATRLLIEYGAFTKPDRNNAPELASDASKLSGRGIVASILEPKRGYLAHELCTAAASIAERIGATTIGFGLEDVEKWAIGSWGADQAVILTGSQIEADIAATISRWATRNDPRLIIAPGTLWGREIAARVAAALGVGLIGDAVELDIDAGQIVAWKPALGGRQLAQITSSSRIQIVTLRPGAIEPWRWRAKRAQLKTMGVPSVHHRLNIVDRSYNDDADVLFSSPMIVGVGMGVQKAEYRYLIPLLDLVDAPLACTRKVADLGWLPRSRQVGLTGHHIAPQLYVAIGLHGGFNHTVGIRRSRVVLAINSSADAPIFEDADVGIVGHWRDVIPLLVRELASCNLVSMTEERGDAHSGKSSCAGV